MKKSNVGVLFALLFLIALGVGPGSRTAWSEPAKSFPTRQITYLVCFAPGGHSHREARRRAPRLARGVLETSPFKTLRDLIDHAKKNPYIVSVGGSGAYTGYHMATLRFEKLIGAKLTYVPYTGAAPQMTSFLGGPLVAVFGASDDLTRYRDKVRILGFATDKRFPGFPDVPTLKEQGIDMVEGVDRGGP